MNPWETVIGLEVHVQLSTTSKLFSGSATRYGAAPNTQANEFDIALPGVLPVMNRQAAVMAVMLGLALEGKINRRSVFARKNYFYPDLPKGYQISQYEIPIIEGGRLRINVQGQEKCIDITRAHLEEDAGKSLHEDFHGMTGIDLNRAGTPLIEVVSEPDMRSAAEAVAYLKKLHVLVRYLDICDGNMQEGSFRCDANVSVRRRGDKKLGTRAELKNINSFRFVQRGIEFEIDRQIRLLDAGEQVVQETRLYDPDSNTTRAMRGKEEAHDYRYFPDPDLPPLMLDQALVDEARQSLPELPDVRRERFVSTYGLSQDEAAALTESRPGADFFEATARAAGGEARQAAHWLGGELAAQLNRAGLEIEACPVSAAQLGGLIRRIADQTLSGKMAKDVFAAMWQGAGDADAIIEARGLRQITDAGAIEAAIDAVLQRHPQQVEQFRAGEHKLLGFFVGQVMKATQGKANPEQVNELLRGKLEG